MNRQERRRLKKAGTEVPKEKVINVKQDDLLKIKEDAANKAADTAFELTLGIPVMVIHDRFSKLIRVEADGKSREERFIDMCLELYDSFQKGYISLEDIRQCLWEEGGIKVERSK